MRYKVNIRSCTLEERTEMGRWCNVKLGQRHVIWKTLQTDIKQFRFKFKKDAELFEMIWKKKRIWW